MIVIAEFLRHLVARKKIYFFAQNDVTNRRWRILQTFWLKLFS